MFNKMYRHLGVKIGLPFFIHIQIIYTIIKYEKAYKKHIYVKIMIS